jgi:hypothetical protein
MIAIKDKRAKVKSKVSMTIPDPSPINKTSSVHSPFGFPYQQTQDDATITISMPSHMDYAHEDKTSDRSKLVEVYNDQTIEISINDPFTPYPFHQVKITNIL